MYCFSAILIFLLSEESTGGSLAKCLDRKRGRWFRACLVLCRRVELVVGIVVELGADYVWAHEMRFVPRTGSGGGRSVVLGFLIVFGVVAICSIIKIVII